MSAVPPATRPSAPLADHDALPPGTRFGEFEILRVLGVGGFGIVYLAQDHSLERKVALKEYMPASLASRGDGAAITIRSGSFADTYAIGLRSFVNEARLLARFDHPSLVKVYRFWEDNATAYMVMPYLQGVTLRDARRAMTHAPDEAWLRGVLEPMLAALEQLHREGVFHRDIAPDNILLPVKGAPILLDFGAARRVISDRTQSLTAILKPSYAPIEQYADMTAMRQGPWTDLYALGAVMHFLMFGAPPAPATARAMQDDVEPIARRNLPGVSPRFVEVVAWMLGVRPLERPQNVAAVRTALNTQVPIPTSPRAGVTIPGAIALSSVGGVAPALGEWVEPVFEPTLCVESAYAASSGVDTARRPSASMTAPGTVASSAVDLARAAAPALASGAAASRVPPVVPRRPPPLGAATPPAAPTLMMSRRGWLAAGGAAAVAVAAVLLWQFVGVLGSPRSLPVAADAASNGASASLAVVAPLNVGAALASARAAAVAGAASASAARPAASQAVVVPGVADATPAALPSAAKASALVH